MPTDDKVKISENRFIINGHMVPAPSGLAVTNYHDPSLHRFRGRDRGQAVTEVIVHETVTRGHSATVRVLKQGGKGVHLIVDAQGHVFQHADLAFANLAHAAPHNHASIGIEVVNPYYPEELRAGLPWKRVIDAPWAHRGRYVVPTLEQAEAVAGLLMWATSPAAVGLSIPRRWVGFCDGRMRMGRILATSHSGPGIYAHHYFNHSDGAWLVLYAWLRLEAGLIAETAYEEAIRRAAHWADIKDYVHKQKLA